jgi:hypothetical protein
MDWSDNEALKQYKNHGSLVLVLLVILLPVGLFCQGAQIEIQ